MLIHRRALAPLETDHERLWLSLALAGLVVIGMGRAAGYHELPRIVCPFRHATGIPCVTCGGTRALLAIARGDVSAALGWNPLVAIVGLAGLAWLAYALVVMVLGAPRIRFRLDDGDRRTLRVAAWILLLANWVFLIVQGR